MDETRKVVALAGGVGGAKLTHGLALLLPPENLTIIVNTGDDFEHFGLHISPDLDTVCYTLAGLANFDTGWGRAGESWNALKNITSLGGPVWFNLGDQDLGTHLERTRRLQMGQSLSAVTQAFCQAWKVQTVVLPMSDDPVRTWVETEELGWLPFQSYFVEHRCEPRVKGFAFKGLEQAQPAPGVIKAIEAAHVVVFCPSNPWVSINPILALPQVRDMVASKKRQGDRAVVAVSPIIGGQAVKGPLAKMYQELGIAPSPIAVAEQYQDLLSGFVLDRVDENQAETIATLGVQPMVTNTLMKTVEDRRRCAGEVLAFCARRFGQNALP